MKPLRAITWTDVDGREAGLIQRCAVRDEDACAELVREHQRMVYQLSLNLLGDHNEALDLSQEVFLRVFRTGDFPEQNDLDSPDRMLGRKELADRIRGALDLLPFDQKTALVLREIDGLSYDEIGFSLGIAVGTVKSRLARAREALRSQLRDV